MRRGRSNSRPPRGNYRPAERRSLGHHQLKSLLEYLVTSLVDDKEAVLITEREKQGKLYYDVKVAKTDMGKLLGRAGKTISSIRAIVRVAAAKAGGDAMVDVEESD